MARRDVAVIGAGLYGTSLACCLAREGLSVALHERTLPGAGDTGRSFGMIRRHYSNEVTVRLAKRGCELLQADPSSAFVRTGYMLTVGPEQSHACLANVALGRKVGVDTDFERDKGYANWFWGMSPSCLKSLVETAGFRVDSAETEPFAQTFVCTPTEVPFAHRLPGDSEARAIATEISAAGVAAPA